MGVAHEARFKARSLRLAYEATQAAADREVIARGASRTNATARAAVARAIARGIILHATAGGEPVTVGPYREVTGRAMFAMFRYGRSRWAGDWYGSAAEIADLAVQHVGRRIGGMAEAALLDATA